MADAIPNDPALVEEMLRQRGLLATGGNIRLMPFGPGSSSPSELPATTGSATAGALATNANGGAPIVRDLSGNPVALDPDATQLPANVPDEEWVNILPALAGAAGAGLALLIKNHLAKRGITLPDDPLAPNVPATAKAGTMGDGDRVVVDGGELVSEGAAEVDPTKAGPKRFPNQSVKALPAPAQSKIQDTGSPPKYLTSRQLAERRAANLPTTETSSGKIQLGDAFTDLSDKEILHAEMIAKQLIERRMAGRKRMLSGKKGTGKLGLPTSEIDPEAVFNNVVRMIREGKIVPNQVRRAVAR